MAKEKWDAIVIGGSFSGMSTGALLAKAGKKVLILEKNSDDTGRMGMDSMDYYGQLLDNGVHGIMTMGDTSEGVFKRLGIPLPKLLYWNDVKILFEGKWVNFKVFVEKGDIANLFRKEILPLSKDDMAKFEDIGSLDWLATKTDNKYTKALFDFAVWGGLVGGMEDSAAGEGLLFLKQCATVAASTVKQGGIAFVGCQCVGGIRELNKCLAAKCKELGVEIRYNSQVVDVVIEDGVAKGVEVLKGKRVIPSHYQDTEFIKAPLVVSSVPIWHLFKVVSEDRFPVWYAEWVKYIASRYVNIGTLYIATKSPAPWGSDLTIWHVPKWPRTGARGGLICYPSYCPEGQSQGGFWFQSNWYDGPSGIDPETWDHAAKNRRDMKKFWELFEEDVYELFPGVKEACLWKLRQNARCQTSPVPANTQRYRPGVQPPGVKNFYITSDTLRDTMPMGTAAAGFCVLKCVDTILANE
jgi:hypothetical protein